MRQSSYFLKTTKETPKDEQSINAQLLERASYIYKNMAGVYTYLPIGLRVLNKINSIIRQEIERDPINGQELYMPAMQSKELWSKTGRWDGIGDVMYRLVTKGDDKSNDFQNSRVGLGTTHEETITEIVSQKISSYQDLPFAVYQIQDKFRNEPRAKSGLMRGREFMMKDLYSFHESDDDLNIYYNHVKKGYLNIFNRCRLDTKITEASGGAFSKQYSHEFQVISDAGEDKIIYCTKCEFAQNLEITKLNTDDHCPNCSSNLNTAKSIEVGNIFKLGTKFSEPLKATYLDKNGQAKPMIMASYGIGPGRLLATIVETHNDDNGIIWPTSVTPFHVHLITIGDSSDVIKKANNFYETLQKNNFEVLYDDRNESAGIKLKDSDLLGISVRIIISDKTKGNFEFKLRESNESKIVNEDNLIKELKSIYRGYI